MIRSSTRGVFLAITVLFSVSLILIPSDVHAEEINVKSIGLDKTTVISFTNDATEDVKVFRIWLGENVNFKSFKTEKGWIGEKNSQGVIIFTTSEPIKTGESVKFGVKTDKSNPTINWKGLDQTNTIIDTGISISTKITKVNQNPKINLDKNGEIFSESTFRIIPDKPNSGSTIRVTGDNFEESQKFNFYINTEKIGIFETDEKGHFITTMKIPNIQTNERVEFKIKNNQGQEKIVSLRLGNDENRIPVENQKLSINNISNIMHRGDNLDIYGMGSPSKSITIKIVNSEKIITNTRTTDVDSKGNWKLIEDITIPYDAPFGKYSVIISDGKNEILKNWQVQTDKIILLKPTKIIFKAGELIKFNGTAIPNNPLELILEDDLGKEIISKKINVGKSGFVEFEYQSKENNDKVGTWTLIASQGNEKEFVYVGYDQMPATPIKFEFNKTNYKSSETAIINFIGEPLDNLTMIVISPTGDIKEKEIPINLLANGRITYELKLSGYESGTYSAVIKKAGTQTVENFSVGLRIGSGLIDAKITQTEYTIGEEILLLGKTNPHTLMTITLIDSDGKQVKTIETSSNNVGIFTENRLKIPSDRNTGIWKINVVSGTNLDIIEFDVISTGKEGLSVKVTKEVEPGDIIKINIIASHKTSITMEITNELEAIIDKTLTCNTTKEFVCETFWPVPKNMIPGTYTIKVNDAINETKTTFKIIPN